MPARWIPIFTDNLALGTGQKHSFVNRGEKKSSAKLYVTLQQFLTELQSHGHRGGMAELPRARGIAVPHCTGAGAGAQRGLRARGSTRNNRAKTGNPAGFLCTHHSDGFSCVGALLSNKAELPTQCL